MDALDRNRIIWEVWAQVRDKCKKERTFRGMDCGGRGLCSNDKNLGTVEQEGGNKRCGLPFCPLKDQVNKTVKSRISSAKRATDLTMIPVFVKQPKLNGAVIDLSKFVSKDELDYQSAHV